MSRDSFVSNHRLCCLCHFVTFFLHGIRVLHSINHWIKSMNRNQVKKKQKIYLLFFQTLLFYSIQKYTNVKRFFYPPHFSSSLKNMQFFLFKWNYSLAIFLLFVCYPFSLSVSLSACFGLFTFLRRDEMQLYPYSYTTHTCTKTIILLW